MSPSDSLTDEKDVARFDMMNVSKGYDAVYEMVEVPGGDWVRWEDWIKDRRVWNLVLLLIEARDALPAITLASARLRGIDLKLAERIESAIEPWRSDGPDAI